MPNIKPISDLRNYTDVLKQVVPGNPVYLTKNGRGQFAIINIQELDELRATRSLFAALEKGEQSAREHGWLSEDDVDEELDLC